MKGTNAVYVGSPVVDEDWLLGSGVVSALSFQWCLVTIGWVMGRASGPLKTYATNLHRFSSGKSKGRKLESTD